MSYRLHRPPQKMLLGYDPECTLEREHLARLIEQLVEAYAEVPEKEEGPGQPEYDPRLTVKVLVYGYATGIRSSRQLERMCRESLPYLYLTRGDGPSYRTLCRARREHGELLKAVWLGMFMVAEEAGFKRMGRIVVDSTKLRANASGESVVKQCEYEPVMEELREILKEAERRDEMEDQEGDAGETRLAKVVERDQMRNILRRVRRRLARREATPETPQEPPNAITPQMRQRVQEGIQALTDAQAEGRKHVSLTDPDARMMPEGSGNKLQECYSWEVAVDQGFLVYAESTGHNNDNDRLEVIVSGAQEPDGVQAVDGDSGYYSSEVIAPLLKRGIDVCVPTSHTACDLHRGQPIGTTRERSRGKAAFTYDAKADVYRCPEGNELHRTQKRRDHGQRVSVYRAQGSCEECALKGECVTQPGARHRTLKVGSNHVLLDANQTRFAEPAHQERYRHRGCAVETVFGFVRFTLGITRWLLRRTRNVACEANLIRAAYQVRKLHSLCAASPR